MSSGPGQIYYEKNEAFEQLVAEDQIFESRIRLLIFCACLGYNQNRRAHDHDDNGETRWMFIDNNQILSVMVASLAYAATDDPEILMQPDEQVDILVQYGAGGSRLLIDRVIDEPGDNLDLLIELLEEERNSDEFSDRVNIISEIEEEVSSL